MKMLTVTNINDGIDTVEIGDILASQPNAWGSYSQTSPGIFESLGISSVTDFAAGQMYWNFFNPFDNETYGADGTSYRDLGTSNNAVNDELSFVRSADKRRTTAARIVTNTSGAISGVDQYRVYTYFFGTIA